MIAATVNEQDDEINWSSDDDDKDVEPTTDPVPSTTDTLKNEEQVAEVTKNVTELDIASEKPVAVDEKVQRLEPETVGDKEQIATSDIDESISTNLAPNDPIGNDDQSASSYDIVDRVSSQTTGKDLEEEWGGWD